eukprot:2428895-Pyramimonas_sp.AAC.1
MVQHRGVAPLEVMVLCGSAAHLKECLTHTHTHTYTRARTHTHTHREGVARVVALKRLARGSSMIDLKERGCTAPFTC